MLNVTARARHRFIQVGCADGGLRRLVRDIDATRAFPMRFVALVTLVTARASKGEVFRDASSSRIALLGALSRVASDDSVSFGNQILNSLAVSLREVFLPCWNGESHSIHSRNDVGLHFSAIHCQVKQLVNGLIGGKDAMVACPLCSLQRNYK